MHTEEGLWKVFLAETGYKEDETGFWQNETEEQIKIIGDLAPQEYKSQRSMQAGDTIFILYFYLFRKFQTIKQQVSNKDSAEGKKLRSRVLLILEKTGIAAITTIAIYLVFMFLNAGLVLFTKEGFAKLNRFHLYEIFFAFLFLLVLFWIHNSISKLMNSAAFQKMKHFNRSFTEALLVVFSTVVALSLINFLPLLLLFPEIEPPAKNLRIAYVVSIIISLFFYYFVERERSKKRLQTEMLRTAQLQKENFQAQLQNLKDQVNPHFLFNSLNVLGSLIEKDQDKAMEFTRRLSDLYRSYLDISHEPLIQLSKELEVTKAYIYLLETRFGKAVEFKLQVPPEKELLYLPPGSLQMLIENAIKHNGSTRRKPLLIEIYSEAESLVVKNRLQPRRNKIISTKTGLKNIQSRYSFLSDKEVIIIKTEEEFIAKIPLLKVEAHENSHR